MLTLVSLKDTIKKIIPFTFQENENLNGIYYS